MVINTNVSAQSSARLLSESTSMLNKSLARLSSGAKIISPEDDAAGLAVSMRFDAQVNRINATKNNVSSAISFTQTQDGFLGKVAKALDRMSELSILAQDVTKSDTDRTLYDAEFQKLDDYITNVGQKDYNSVSLFDGSTLAVTQDSEGSTFNMNSVDLGAAEYTALNAALQLKAEDAIETFMRFSINTFFGLGGLLDIASELGIERHYEDFGLTLGRWGVPTGPYFVMPIYGPSTLRDTLAFTTETAADPVLKVTDLAAKDSLVILRGLSLRASLLRLDDVLEGAALDKYTFSRDAFMQRRASLVLGDREPPEPPAAPPAAPATAPGTVPVTAPTATPADPVKK